MRQEEKERVQAEARRKKFETPLGQRVHDVLFGGRPRSVDAFLPGRTFYVIDFDENAADVPITQYRPKHEVRCGREGDGFQS